MPGFADRLRALREKAGLTQAQLAERTGLPLGSIRNYEQGLREPYWQVVFRLAEGLDVGCEAFADCDGTRPDAGTKVRPRKSTPAAKPKRPRSRPRKGE